MPENCLSAGAGNPDESPLITGLNQERGFSLLELLLACGLGLIIAGSALQALLSEEQLGARLGVRLRQRQLLLRANQLIADDIARGTAITDALPPVCQLAGRKLWMQIVSTDGAVTSYSLGDPPSAIWQGQVLMRCGKAYGLDGRVQAGSAVMNRVVLDGLSPNPQPWLGCGLPQAIAIGDGAVCWERSSGAVQWQLHGQSRGLSLSRDGQALLQG